VAIVASLLTVTRSDAAASPGGTKVVRTGALVATVTYNPFSVVVTQRGVPVLQTSTSGPGPLAFALGGGAAAQTPLAGYGIIADAPVAWVQATRAEPRSDGSLLVHTTDPLHSFRVRLTTTDEGVVDFNATPTNKSRVLMTGASFANDASQRFLGFGERSDSVDQTGRTVEQWNEEGPFSGGMFRPATDPVLGKQWQGPPPFGPASNFTMPWAISSRGYGFLLDSTWLNRFDLQSSKQWTVETHESTLHWRVYGGPHPTDVLQRVTADKLVGRQPPPAQWFFGPWYQPHGNDAQLLTAWRTPRSKGGLEVPITVAQTYTHYLPCAAQAGDRATGAQKKQTDGYHAWGYKVTTYVNSFVCTKHPDNAYAVGNANGYFVKTKAGNTYPMPFLSYTKSSSAIVDFTAPGAARWWQSLITEALTNGYDGWMEDFGEFVPPDAKLADGRPGFAGHNDYCTLYHRASHQLTWPRFGSNFAQFVRCGYTGTAPFARIVWGGDPSEDDSEADGLPAAVSEGLSMGMSGISYWGSDIGGFHALFTAGETSPELLTRWAEFGAFSGIMRTEADGVPRPVLAGSPRAQVWDPAVLPHWRALSRLRTQLFPYIWDAAQQYQRSGTPIMRDLAVAYPDEEVAWRRGDARSVAAARYEYMFGSDLLVAPVVTVGQTGRDVWLPPGQWVDFWKSTTYDDASGAYNATATQTVVDGGRVVHVESPLGHPPLFVKAGTCLTLLPPDVQTLTNDAGFAHDANVVTLADAVGRTRQLGFATRC
jgi:alpha-glucosidase (family GH31 glycosyl hydrolase)